MRFWKTPFEQDQETVWKGSDPECGSHYIVYSTVLKPTLSLEPSLQRPLKPPSSTEGLKPSAKAPLARPRRPLSPKTFDLQRSPP